MEEKEVICDRCKDPLVGEPVEYKGTKICVHCATWSSWAVRPGACNFFDRANLSEKARFPNGKKEQPPWPK